ncbi:MAG: NADPH-dependent FMN reductase [Sciscionella sp.]
MAASIGILLVSGSTRDASTNTAALRTVRALATGGVEAVLYGRLAELPAFNPDHDERWPIVVSELRQQIAAADAVLFCTPEYAGSLPGSFKNLLDWTVGGGEMDRKPVAWITVAAEGRGGRAAEVLSKVLGYLGTVVIEPACVRLPVGRDAVGPEGTVTDPDVRSGLTKVIGAIIAHVSAATGE